MDALKIIKLASRRMAMKAVVKRAMGIGQERMVATGASDTAAPPVAAAAAAPPPPVMPVATTTSVGQPAPATMTTAGAGTPSKLAQVQNKDGQHLYTLGQAREIFKKAEKRFRSDELGKTAVFEESVERAIGLLRLEQEAEENKGGAR